MKRAVVGAWLTVIAVLAWSSAPALASSGIQHLHFAAGPYTISPGANLILLQYTKVPKPRQDGYLVRAAPNLRLAKANGKCCGKIPMVSQIHLHHGVWLSNGAAGAGEGSSAYGGFYPFMAVGEEKTIFTMPKGYGYPVGAHDWWILNYMIHDLTSNGAKVYITYDIDFIPMSSPLAKHITPVHPLWNDVESGSLYPVFDVHRFSGRHGIFTFPDMAPNAYPGRIKNLYTITHDGTLIGTAGHVHPGGLYTDLDLIRSGASPSHGAIRGVVPHSVRLFRSFAHYWDKRGPISWDLAMTATPKDWRPSVKAGDVLRVSATYETRRASWYESMGIMVVWEAYNDTTGVDPFTHKLDQHGHTTHGYLPENNDNGGSYSVGYSLKGRHACHPAHVAIRKFTFLPGDFTASGRQACIPTIHSGQALTFVNDDAHAAPPGAIGFNNLLSPQSWYTKSIFHSVTSCANPCGMNTGISYPLANGRGNYDSGQLGPWLPAVGTLTWSTPTNLAPGTYTYFCRIHPFMRGVFRVIS